MSHLMNAGSMQVDMRAAHGSKPSKLPALATAFAATVLLSVGGASHAAFKIAPTENVGRYFPHTTVLGDTLTSIKARYLVAAASIEALQKINNIKNPNVLGVGREIRIPVAMLREESAPARVTAVSGQADMGNTGMLQVKVGDNVRTGDKVRTGADGFVTLQLADGSTLVVQSKTQIEMESANRYVNTGGVGDTIVRVNTGRVETRVVKQRGPAARYEIRTATSNMGVRGTAFRVAADATGARAQTEVIEGRVGVAGATTTSNELGLDAGFGSIVAAGKPPSAPIALLPAPLMTGLPTVFESPAVTFTIKPISQAAAYSAQVALDPEFRELVGVTDSASPQLTFQNLPDGDLYVRIRGVDGQQLQGNDAAMKFAVRARPFAPQLIAYTKPMPAAKLAWQSAPDAIAYRVQIGTTEAFLNLLADAKVEAQNQFVPASALAPGRYFWRVASVGKNGRAGPFSAASQFSIEQEMLRLIVLPQRTAGLQLNGKVDVPSGTLNAKHTKVTWMPGPAGSMYLAQISIDDRFSKIVESRRLNANELLMDKLKPNTYFVRIKILRLDAGGIEIDTPWSDTEAVDVYPI